MTDAAPDRLARALHEKARAGRPGAAEQELVAAGPGWRVLDLVCTAGPADRAYEERQPVASVSIVTGGTFSYRSRRGPSLLSTGSLLLVDAERPFECSHEHGEGDRCLSFQFDAELLEQLARGAGVSRIGFEHDRLPPLRALAALTARAQHAGDSRDRDALEEIAIELAGTALRVAGATRRSGPRPGPDRGDRIAKLLRHLEGRSGEALSLGELAARAGLSPYHFLRTFKAVTGVTPHQWLLRTRLREAARRLATTDAPVTDVALDVGFDDLSNFIRSFRAEFGASPRRYREQHAGTSGASTRPLSPRRSRGPRAGRAAGATARRG